MINIKGFDLLAQGYPDIKASEASQINTELYHKKFK